MGRLFEDVKPGEARLSDGPPGKFKIGDRIEWLSGMTVMGHQVLGTIQEYNIVNEAFRVLRDDPNGSYMFFVAQDSIDYDVIERASDGSTV